MQRNNAAVQPHMHLAVVVENLQMLFDAEHSLDIQSLVVRCTDFSVGTTGPQAGFDAALQALIPDSLARWTIDFS